MPKFFKEFFEHHPFIEGDDAAHISKSLRMKVGEALTVCDTKGFDYHCVISAVSNQRIDLEVVQKCKTTAEPTVFVTLYLCLTKGDKMDTAVKQAVEMGASAIVPVVSTNCVSRPDAKTLDKKCERWQRIANEAAGQSGRGKLPCVKPCISLKQAAELIKNDDLCLFFYELGGTPLEKIDENCKNISVIIGPEGGFSNEEAQMLQKHGARVTTLGSRILRAETAPVAAMAIVMLQSNNM